MKPISLVISAALVLGAACASIPSVPISRAPLPADPGGGAAPAANTLATQIHDLVNDRREDRGTTAGALPDPEQRRPSNVRGSMAPRQPQQLLFGIVVQRERRDRFLRHRSIGVDQHAEEPDAFVRVDIAQPSHVMFCGAFG